MFVLDLVRPQRPVPARAAVFWRVPTDFDYLRPAASTTGPRRHFRSVTYPEFEARWQPSGEAKRANYGLFLTDLCDLLGVPRSDATTDSPAQDAYVLERAVTFDDGATKKSTGRIDLYKRGCFVLETKQGTDSPDTAARTELAQLGLPAEKRRKGHAQRNTPKWRLSRPAIC